MLFYKGIPARGDPLTVIGGGVCLVFFARLMKLTRPLAASLPAQKNRGGLKLFWSFFAHTDRRGGDRARLSWGPCPLESLDLVKAWQRADRPAGMDTGEVGTSIRTHSLWWAHPAQGRTQRGGTAKSMTPSGPTPALRQNRRGRPEDAGGGRPPRLTGRRFEWSGREVRPQGQTHVVLVGGSVRYNSCPFVGRRGTSEGHSHWTDSLGFCSWIAQMPVHAPLGPLALREGPMGTWKG